MTDFLSHFKTLASSQEEPSSRDRNAIEEWLRYAQDSKSIGTPSHELNVEVYNEEGNWDSVLDVYKTSHTGMVARSELLSQVLKNPEREHILYELHAILSSTKPDDSISEELAELIGFEDIELVMQILDRRSSFTTELGEYLLQGDGFHTQGWDTDKLSLDPDAARRRMEEMLRENSSRPLTSGIMENVPEALPHVYTSSLAQGNVLSHLGTKFALPVGHTTEDHEDYEEVVLPPTKPVPPRASERLIPVSELDPLAKGSFPGYTSLNRIQSIVYPTAYRSNENMLVCAPTGAGKTDVAMLTVLRVLNQHRSTSEHMKSIGATINRDAFKIIYVAPMKALAAEIVRKLGKRLQWLSIQVKELTGDMQMTKAEMAATQIIVTTPEKWDVVTRKPTGEGELVSSVKLLIIDEVHLLNDERGAVIEAIVARTLRQVEFTQSVIRIVGLSATLPNYLDVADFLGVNRQSGMFYFDSSFRPVPLEQHFIGVRGKLGSPQFRRNLERVTFEKVADLVKEGHQVMVFVHSRKDTVHTAQGLKEAALAEGCLEDFSCEEHPTYSFFRSELARSRNKEMKELFEYGFGIHHAGMLREDRTRMERLFEARVIKVLCCTATLAWGVNLPAHAVIIKGTQVYDSSRGAFTDLSILDVLQVFGRAGRPGMESSGIGFICTSDDKHHYYLDAVTSQIPIESRFNERMVDALNAETSLGTVGSINDAVQWLRYTYLYVRMRKNPLQYGLSREEVIEDPFINSKLHEFIQAKANQLAKARMITFDHKTEKLLITDLGRIAAKYYISHESIEVFNERCNAKMSEADVLHVLSKSSEFKQIQLRESEERELKFLEESVICNVPGHTDTVEGKVNILLQAYISGNRPQDFALVSDQAYVAQNAGRIIRALLEIAITRKWAKSSAGLMGMSKAIEKHLWPFDHPLKQFPLKRDVLHMLDTYADDYTPAELASMTSEELGTLVRMNSIHGGAIREAAKHFPTAQITYDLRPLGPDVLKISVRVARAFNWSTKIHGSVEPFWLWVEDHEGLVILQLFHLIFRQSTDALDVDFVISIPNKSPPPFVTIRFVSDKWIGAEEEVPVQFDDLIMPTEVDSSTLRLDIPFFGLSVLQDPVLESSLEGRLHSFNSIQSQAFWSLVNTRMHALLCAPTGCGKSLVGQIAMWRTLENADPGSWVLVIVPKPYFMQEVLGHLGPISEVKGIQIGSVNQNSVLKPPREKAIRVVLSTFLPSILSRSQQSNKRFLSGLRLVVCENLELLDPSYELGVTSLLHATQTQPTRYIGLSNSLTDPTDLAAWLKVDPFALHSFPPSDREQALSTITQTFTIPQTAALFKAMAKPAHDAIRDKGDKQAIVFVPSRGLCSSIARDLVTQCALESETDKGYLPAEVTPDHLEAYLIRSQDVALVEALSRGVGFFHGGLSKQDRSLVLEMYTEGIVRVLIVPRDALWSLPVRAGVVVVMGTQYFHITPSGERLQLQNYGWEELVQMQGRAVRHGAQGYFHLFCQTEGMDTLIRFLSRGLPLESRLLETGALQDWYQEQKQSGQIRDKQDVLDALSFTYLARRLESNPNYYDASSGSKAEVLSRVVDKFYDVTST